MANWGLRPKNPYCGKGHLKSGDNAIFDTDGYAVCRICKNSAMREWRHKTGRCKAYRNKKTTVLALD